MSFSAEGGLLRYAKIAVVSWSSDIWLSLKSSSVSSGVGRDVEAPSPLSELTELPESIVKEEVKEECSSASALTKFSSCDWRK